MILVLLVLAANFFFVVVVILWLLRRLWRATRPGQIFRRTGIVAAGLLLLASPYIAFKVYERHFVLARVPEPLEVASVEYRLEKRWGSAFLYLPGDNETGFVVYRLTDASSRWARNQGDGLAEILPGGAKKWHLTPVDDDGGYARRWHPYDDDPQMMSVTRPKQHPPTIAEYLEKYGFTIPIEEGRTKQADQAIQSEESFYAYGRGGSVTIVDPIHGNVYFAYAG